MKKSTSVLCALLFIGIAQMGMIRTGYAQPPELGYNQTLALSKQDFKAKNYEAAGQDAQNLLTLATSPEETGNSLTLLAETFYRRKMYNEAKVQWNKALNLSGTEDDEGLQTVAHLGLARTYAAQSSFDKAIPEYKAVIQSFTQEDDKTALNKAALAPFSFALANTYYNTQQYDLAQEQLSQIIASSQDNPVLLVVALTKSGQIDMIQRKFKKSLAEFQQILDILNTKDFKGLTLTSPSGIKAYAQRQLPMLNGLILSHLEEGDINGGIKINFAPTTEFDHKIDAFTQMFMDDVIVDGIIIDSL